MSKPTLEQLKYYLDAGLKFTSELDKPEHEYGKTRIHTLDGVVYLFGDYCLNSKEYNDAYPIQMCKPILRPMSGLTKKLTIEGEEKIPIEYIVEDILKRELNGVAELTIKEFIMNFHDLYFTKDYTDNIRFADLCAIFQFLVKHKFDVFNGIGTWAIDVNTLTENIY